MTEDSSKTECVSIQNSSKICTEGNHTVYSEDCNDNTFVKEKNKISHLPPSLVNSTEKDKLNFNLFDGCNIFKKEDQKENVDENESDEEDNEFVKKEAVNLDKEEDEDEDDFIKKASAETNDTSVSYFSALPKSLVPEESKKEEHKFAYEEDDVEEEIDETNDKIHMIYPLLDSDDEEKKEIKEEKSEAEAKKEKKDDIKEEDPFNTAENKLLLSNLLVLAKEQTSCRYLQQIIDKNPKMGTVFFYPKGI